ncbi:MAG TPA: class I SAM-dependent methyltransferase [Solirubrobacteraceae bacterium]|jgi:SAM-dependent methyltransferase
MREQRRLAFGSAAELYDRRRPSYPAQLVDDVIEYARNPGSALEVGSGTGRATLLFAERGIAVHGLEPSAEMAAVARRACAGYEVEIEETDFERFTGGDGRFDLIFSAQAWHWVSPDLRVALARRALRHGGALALFWNSADWKRSPHRQALLDAYRRVTVDWEAVGGAGPMHPAADEPFPERPEEGLELRASPDFGEPEHRFYEWTERYATAAYLELISTHSDHLLLREHEREALLGSVAEVLDGLGGELKVPYLTALTLARTV